MFAMEQAVPQPPQFTASVWVETSQPSRTLLLLQSAKPLLHAPSQIPLSHAAEMLLPEQSVAEQHWAVEI